MFICRTCLNFENNLFPMQDLVQDLYVITGLHVERDALMCPACIQKLNEASAFRQQALRADKSLKRKQAEAKQQLLELAEVKEEPVEEIELVLRVDKTFNKSVNDNLSPVSFGDNDNEILFDGKKIDSQEKRKTRSSKQNTRRYKRETEHTVDGCPYCFYQAINKKELMRHINEHIVKNGGIECDHCTQKFKDKRAVKEHLLRAHKGDRSRSKAHKTNECIYCGELLPSRHELKRHTNDKHGDMQDAFKCYICSKEFPKKANLMQHVRLHDKSNQFQCSQCDKKFTCLTYLKMHEHRHVIGKPFICSVCGKSFSQKANLTEHESIHSSEKRYECAHCGNFFKTTRLLKSHLLTHADIYKHSCPECGMNFKRASNLREHLLSHSEKRDFSCHLCSTVFKAKASLKRHLKKHMDQQPQISDVKSLFTDSYDLQSPVFDFDASKIELLSPEQVELRFLNS